MKVKVCGLKYFDNIQEIIKLEVDFIGFVFYNKSIRYVEECENIEYLSSIVSDIHKVGVFVNASYNEITTIVNRFSLTAVQLHADENPSLCAQLREKDIFIIKAFSVNDNFDFSICDKYSHCCDMFVFDTKTIKYGGSGCKFNWQILSKYKANIPFMLSGGISIVDVDIIKSFKHEKFIGVDLNSKFETAPAEKNILLLQKFISEIK